MTNPTIPTVTLNNGVTMPQLGFGVFQVPDEETEAAVSAALEAGYRSIDTATIYGNERSVGRAIAASGVPREELFLTTKLWNSDHERAVEAYDASVERLGMEADLYLIHWPTPGRDLYLRAWEGLERLYADKRVRAIGVSNFLPEHLDRVVSQRGIVPAVNQIEVHPLLQQRDIQAADTRLGVATEAWSPLAKGGALLAEEAVTAIAERLGRTPAQVVIRWHLQQDRIVIPKTVTPARMAENLDVFDFDLTADDLAALDALEDGTRTGPDPATFNGA
ncbi:aldo/keto reductase [Nocardioides sp. zg-536]|uniref:Aldo/keto reductase n=1 Tax=Nocardioides faecalis TaxID=2803858 RepID=A0A939BX55_9ACTN|nr:aldo/keto reductase [Nocardioides faecalis]MBM9461771.1 aldo/keto reductase [Nocardioides faecalis]QVI58970.1 aldo/keto reductase [Nocardioides faecalis]